MTSSESSNGPNEQVVALAITDPEFRQAMIDNPEEAVRSRGIELTSDDMARLTALSAEDRQQLAEQLATRQSASMIGGGGAIGGTTARFYDGNKGE
jgi:hypothetical protein